MMMCLGESWHCTNGACRAEVSVQAPSQSDGVNPHCSCGSAMKKKYTSPVFRYLDFLQVEDEVLSEQFPVPGKKNRRWPHSPRLLCVRTEEHTRCEYERALRAPWALSL
jgi:hypothetical protein